MLKLKTSLFQNIIYKHIQFSGGKMPYATVA